MLDYQAVNLQDCESQLASGFACAHAICCAENHAMNLELEGMMPPKASFSREASKKGGIKFKLT